MAIRGNSILPSFLRACARACVAWHGVTRGARVYGFFFFWGGGGGGGGGGVEKTFMRACGSDVCKQETHRLVGIFLNPTHHHELLAPKLQLLGRPDVSVRHDVFVDLQGNTTRGSSL